MSLFSPIQIREITFRNRIAVSPMCQYSSEDGFATDWHLVHLGSRAVGGAGMVMLEASAVSPEGRISPHDLGIWKDEHIAKLREIAGFIWDHGAIPAIQLAHAGRKASMRRPWDEPYGIVPEAEGGWSRIVAPSAVPFHETYLTPVELSLAEIERLIESFVEAAMRAEKAGFEVIELHGAHGYLIHEFLSPLSNHRTDEFGGGFEGRTRFVRMVVAAVREVWPKGFPLFLRLSCTDWVEGGWDISQTVRLAQELHEAGVDVVDCSSGGNAAGAQIPIGPGYQVPFAEAVHQAGVPSVAVGLITDPHQANTIIESGQADFVMLAREFLRDPYWPLHAAHALGVDVEWPAQYRRAKP
jgi:2,4-dienoyl-CoA reductase-like NADH-dependent reductase (Old Yellow Enzyme family)